MRSIEKTLFNRAGTTECSCIPHMIYLSDFNTNHPSPNRIDRIASEINTYLKLKCKYTDGVKQY